jgi:hypothetical protein
MAIVTVLVAQRMVVKHDGEIIGSGGTVADGVDDGDGDRAWGREGGCLACSWCRGDAQGGSRGQGEV